MFERFISSCKKPQNVVAILAGILFCIGLLMQVPGAIHEPVFTGGDAGSYLDAGKYFWIHFQLHYFRTFGYALFTGFPFLLGTTEWVAQMLLVLLNGFFYVASARILFNLAVRISNSNTLSVIISCIFILSPGIWFVNYATLSEPLFIFILLRAMQSFLNFVETYNTADLLWTSLYLMFSAAVRPVNLHFSILVAILVFLVLLKRQAGWRNVTLLVTGSMLMIFVPMSRMKHTYGVFTYTNNSKYMLYHYICSYANSIPQSTQVIMYDSFHRNALMIDTLGRGNIKPEQVNWIRRDSLYSAGIRYTIAHKKKQLAVAWFNDLVENMSSPSHQIDAKIFRSNFTFAGEALKTISRFQNMAMSIIGIALSGILCLIITIKILRQKWTLRDFFILGITAQFAIILILSALSFWQGDRFSITYYPIVLLLIVIAVARWKSNRISAS